MDAGPVLVAYATRHHGTEGIATAVATALRSTGLRVELRRAANIASVGRYSAVVLGSAVYMAQWQPAALALLERERNMLAQRPVWLFSSGPVGDGKTTRRPQTVPQPEAVVALAEAIGVRGLAMFGGRVDTAEAGFDIQVMTQAGLGGDWRDLGRVRSWSLAIAASLHAEAVALSTAAPG